MKRLGYALIGLAAAALAIAVVVTQHASWWQPGVHRFWAPAVLVVIALLLHADAWTAAGLAWCAHIGFDRSLGFGLRTREGFQRG